MSLTDEDLAAIGALMDSKLEPVKTDIADLKQGQAEMQKKQDEMQKDISRINGSVTKIEVEYGFEIGAIHDGIIDLLRDRPRVPKLEAKVENHDARIWALEAAVKAKAK